MSLIIAQFDHVIRKVDKRDEKSYNDKQQVDVRLECGKVEGVLSAIQNDCVKYFGWALQLLLNMAFQLGNELCCNKHI